MDRKRILLIDPPFYRLFKETFSLVKYPLSLGYLAAAVRMHTDWDVLVYNGDFSPVSEPLEMTYLTGQGFQNYLKCLKDLSGKVWQEIRTVVSEYGPAVVGISAKSPTFASVRAVASLVKKVDAGTMVVVGGPHPTVVGSRVLDCPDIDVCVVGEGEKTLIDLLRAFENQIELAGVRGIFYRQGGRAVATLPRESVKDLDALGFPHQFAPEVLRDYVRYPLKAFRHIFATRGCPRNCFFCGSREMWGRRVRFRSPENVAQEIKSLQNKGLKFVHFDDDMFGVNPRYLRALSKEILDRCPGIHWSCETHVRLISRENVSFMKAAGCYMIQLGVESGNDRILSEIRKGFTIKEALEACEVVNRHDISLETFFMAGFPQETRETLRDTLRAIERIDCDKVVYSIFTPYPGTEAFDFCRKKGLIDDSYDASLHNHQSPANCFCLRIAPEQFRALSARIEQAVDEKNRLGRARKVERYSRLLGPDFSAGTPPVRRDQALKVSKILPSVGL